MTYEDFVNSLTDAEPFACALRRVARFLFLTATKPRVVTGANFVFHD